MLHANEYGSPVHLFTESSDEVKKATSFCNESAGDTVPVSELGYDPESIHEVLEHEDTCRTCANRAADYMGVDIDRDDSGDSGLDGLGKLFG